MSPTKRRPLRAALRARDPRPGRVLAISLLLAALALPAAAAQERKDGDALDAYFRGLPAFTIPIVESPPENSFFLTYRVAGADKKRTIVLLHGINSSGYSMAPLARELESDFRVILVDLPGYGDSYTARPIDYSYAAMVRRLLVLLKAVDALDGALLVGHSTGGALAWHLELEESCRPAGVVLIDAVTVDYRLPFLTRLAAGLLKAHPVFAPVFQMAGPQLIAGAIARGAVSETFKPSPASVERMKPAYTTAARMRVSAQWARKLLGRAIVGSWEPALNMIEAPVLLVWGARDTVLSPMLMYEAQARIPNAKTQVILGAGHACQEEKPQEVAARIRDFADPLPLADDVPELSPEIRPAGPDQTVWPPRELAVKMLHATLSVSAYDQGGPVDSLALHVKHGYYAPEYPSQSGHLGAFLEARPLEGRLNMYLGFQTELVWAKVGGFRFAFGWNVLSGGPSRMQKIGYVPSYAPWLCVGVSWFGHTGAPGFFVTLELAPKLYKTFGF